MKRNIYYLIIYIFISIPVTLFANSFNEPDIIKLKSAGHFNSKPIGTIAFLPKVGSVKYLKKVATHWVLPEAGKYILTKKGDNYFFRVNHSQNRKDTSYLGVFAYIIYDTPPTHRNEIFIRRNEASWDGKERKLDKKLSGPSRPEITLEDFFQAHAKDNVINADELLSFTWHAAVKTGEPYSWDYKYSWLNSKPQKLEEFLNVLNISADSYYAAITAHIIQFTTTPYPTIPLDFSINTYKARGIYIKTFSPLSTSFGKELYIVLNKK